MELAITSNDLNDANDNIILQNHERSSWLFDDQFAGILKNNSIKNPNHEAMEGVEHAIEFNNSNNGQNWYSFTENLMLDELSLLCRNLHEKLQNLNDLDLFENKKVTKEELDVIGTTKRSSSCENISHLINNSTYEDGNSVINSNFERNSKFQKSLPLRKKYSFKDSQTGNKNLKKGSWNLDEHIIVDELSETNVDEMPNVSNESSERYANLNQDQCQGFKNDKHLNAKNHSKKVIESDGKKQDKDENRSTKKVGFSKTEIHFAPDTGKINIVETDGKPPPTNKFRRRRRDYIKNNNNFPTERMPITHFGDTWYEKYNLGASKHSNVKQLANVEDASNKFNKITDRCTLEKDDDYTVHKMCNEADVNMDKKNENMKHKGHISTINFTAEDTPESANIVQDDSDMHNSSSYLNLNKDTNTVPTLKCDTNNSLITRTTKMTVHIPFVKPEIQHLKDIPFSSLKSVQLILNLKSTIDENKMKDLFTSFCDSGISKPNTEDFDKEKKINYDEEDEYTWLFKDIPDPKFNESYHNLPLESTGYWNSGGNSLQKKLGQRLIKDINEKSHNLRNCYAGSNNSKNSNYDVIYTKTSKINKPIYLASERIGVNTSTKNSKLSNHATNLLSRTQSAKKQSFRDKTNNATENLIYVNIFDNNSKSENKVNENVHNTNTLHTEKEKKNLTQGDKKTNTIKNGLNKKVMESNHPKNVMKNMKKGIRAKEVTLKKGTLKNSETVTNTKKASENRFKKPVEIVYKTAIFNMKNEALSKPMTEKKSKSNSLQVKQKGSKSFSSKPFK